MAELIAEEISMVLENIDKNILNRIKILAQMHRLVTTGIYTTIKIELLNVEELIEPMNSNLIIIRSVISDISSMLKKYQVSVGKITALINMFNKHFGRIANFHKTIKNNCAILNDNDFKNKEKYIKFMEEVMLLNACELFGGTNNDLVNLNNVFIKFLRVFAGVLEAQKED
jgi:hypothetical protein